MRRGLRRSDGHLAVERPERRLRPVGEPGPDSDRFLLHAERRLRSLHPKCVRLAPPGTDGGGHLLGLALADELDQLVRLNPGAATVLPARGGGDEQFPRMWPHVTALAALRRPVVWDGDDDVLIDVTMTVEQATRAYRWT